MLCGYSEMRFRRCSLALVVMTFEKQQGALFLMIREPAKSLSSPNSASFFRSFASQTLPGSSSPR
jgi:hypothetical protein